MLRSLFLAVVALSLVSSLARADAPRTPPHTTPPHTTPPETAPPPHTTPGTTPVEPWRDAYRQARAAYDAGRLDEALTSFVRASDLGGPPTLFYDRALTLDRLGRTSEAITTYRQYLDAVPAATNRDVVEARLAELQPPPSSSLATRVAPPPSPILTPITSDAPTVTPTTSASTDAYLATHARPTEDHWEQQGPEWVASWVMLGLTAATTVATILVWNDGLASFQRLQDLCASAMGCTHGDIDDSSAHTSQDVTNALLGISIGLGALTILTFVVEGVVTGNRMRFVRGDAAREGVRFSLGPMGLSLAGTF